MSAPEIIGEIENALANVKESALALLGIADTLEGDRRFILQQIAWSIQNEIELVEACFKEQTQRASQTSVRADQTTIALLNPTPATPDG
ncbi:hypothetical protein [Bradyrhizobium sp. LHD-71]|uniref:hypothetical protein n=1 Tax=Bradyrhizobium sp. LHD-71 TaxID=3072141 RepID=UPI00280F4B6F|nr:hypothetical protein [Bradyrhizobium sp. LHD-71]MDQ8730501.1 hypothetical protein [Bradyrhizobium sp. LHD-71]